MSKVERVDLRVSTSVVEDQSGLEDVLCLKHLGMFPICNLVIHGYEDEQQLQDFTSARLLGKPSPASIQKSISQL